MFFALGIILPPGIYIFRYGIILSTDVFSVHNFFLPAD